MWEGWRREGEGTHLILLELSGALFNSRHVLLLLFKVSDDAVRVGVVVHVGHQLRLVELLAEGRDPPPHHGRLFADALREAFGVLRKRRGGG